MIYQLWFTFLGLYMELKEKREILLYVFSRDSKTEQVINPVNQAF